MPKYIRKASVSVKLSNYEKLKLKSHCKLQGKSVSKFIRELIDGLYVPIVTENFIDDYGEPIKKIGLK